MPDDSQPTTSGTGRISNLTSGSGVSRRRWLKLGGAAALTGLSGCSSRIGGAGGLEGTTIRLLTFGSHESAMQGMAESFTEETGVEVEIGVFQDDWNVIAQQKAGATDLQLFQLSMRAVPSALNDDLIQEIRMDNVPLAENIYDKYRPANTPWEPDAGTWHAVPNHFGANSLAWNTEQWPYDEDPTSWRDLLQPELEGEVGYSQRPNYAVATTYIQFWPEGAQEFEENYDSRIEKVWDSLENEWKPQVGTWFEGGGAVSQAFANGNVTAGHNFYVIAYQLQQDGNPIDVTVPEEGGFTYIDGLAVPRGVEDPKREAAERFINFSLDPEQREEYLQQVPTGTTFPIPEEFQSQGYKQNVNVQYQDRLDIFDPVLMGERADEWTSKIQEIIRG